MADFRVLLFDNEGNPEGELSKSAGTLESCSRSEEINSEHYLSLTTTTHLEVGTRALTHHADGRWREWVVDEPGETHDTGAHAMGTYHLCWSLQYDLQTVYGSIREVGMVTAATAKTGLAAALDGTSRWTVGTCDVMTKASSVVMNTGESAWDRLTTMVKRWGGEIDAEITVNNFGVTKRQVALRDHLGSTSPNRRFEWGHNMTSITRTPDPGPYVCRIIPEGNGETEEAADGVTTYSVALGITSAASFTDSSKGIAHEKGTRYIRDTQSEAVFRVKNPSGAYEYPSAVVSYSTDDVDDLVKYAKEDILQHTRPGVSYTGNVADFEEAGMDVDGIVLGDEVQIVDRGFNPDAELREEERVIRIEVDEMGVDGASLTIGKLKPSLERTIATVSKTVGTKEISYNTPTWDASKYTTNTPNLSHYTVDEIDSDGYSYEVPSYDVDMPDYSTAISGIDTRLSDIEAGVASIGGFDSIIHQLNGVTMTSGTINFTTSSSSGGSSGSSSATEAVSEAATAWGAAIGAAVKNAVGSSWGS